MQASVRTCWVNCTGKLLLMIQALVCQFPTRKWWFIRGPPGGAEGALCSAYISRFVTATDTIILCHMLWFLGTGPLQSLSCQWHFLYCHSFPFCISSISCILFYFYFCYLSHFSFCLLFSHIFSFIFSFISSFRLIFYRAVLSFQSVFCRVLACFISIYFIFPSSSHLIFLYRSLHFAVPSLPFLFLYHLFLIIFFFIVSCSLPLLPFQVLIPSFLSIFCYCSLSGIFFSLIFTAQSLLSLPFLRFAFIFILVLHFSSFFACTFYISKPRSSYHPFCVTGHNLSLSLSLSLSLRSTSWP